MSVFIASWVRMRDGGWGGGGGALGSTLLGNWGNYDTGVPRSNRNENG